MSDRDKQEVTRDYYAHIELIDTQFGRLMKYLDDNGLRENTIVIYTADHGDMLGDFGFFAKSCFYRGSVNIPLIVSIPGFACTGSRLTELVGLQDLLPTLASLAGLQLDREVDGLDLSPLLQGSAFRERECYVSCFGDDPCQSYMVADREHKYI